MTNVFFTNEYGHNIHMRAETGVSDDGLMCSIEIFGPDSFTELYLTIEEVHVLRNVLDIQYSENKAFVSNPE